MAAQSDDMILRHLRRQPAAGWSANHKRNTERSGGGYGGEKGAPDHVDIVTLMGQPRMIARLVRS